MYASAVPRLDPRASATSAVAALLVHELGSDVRGVAIPCPEAHLVVRFGGSARCGLDAHAFGVRETVHRKLLRAGQRTVTARLHLGAVESVLGVPASSIAGRIAPLEDLWSGTATRRFFDRLASARDMTEAATILRSAVAERFANAGGHPTRLQLVLAAVDRLTGANVNAVAVGLGVSERHLRRVFHETIGVGPKTFVRLTRFRRAMKAAREASQVSWAGIASCAGYYDQAHFIAECRTIAGVTPEVLLAELRASQSIG